MSITLGVYDVFGYAAPGSLYLALLAWIGTRLGWLDPVQLLRANTALTVIGAALASYLLGHMTYVLGLLAYLRLSPWARDMAEARQEFVRRVPAAADRPFLAADRSVLESAVEMHETTAAMETARLRAVGFMLRNTAPPLALGAVAAIVAGATGSNLVAAACCAVGFPLAAAACLYRGSEVLHWANVKTLELALWIPGIDEMLEPRPAAHGRAPGRVREPGPAGQVSPRRRSTPT
jgi:hypothetical protein